jgi:hypothetical protein
MTKSPDIARMDARQRFQLRENANRLSQAGTEAQKVQADGVLAELLRIEESEELARRASVASLAIPERVANAFNEMPPTETETRLLQVLLDNPDSSSEALSAALNWKGLAWHMHFGEMSKKREHLLWTADHAVVRDASFYCGILALFSDSSRGFTIKPEVADGLAMIGVKSTTR